MTMRARIVVLVGALGWSLLAEHVVDGWSQPYWIPIADLGVGWALIGSGLVGMTKRPNSVAGTRLVLAGFLWWVGNFQLATDQVVGAVGFAFQGYHDVVLAVLVLSFPGRWPARRVDRAVLGAVGIMYCVNSLVRLGARLPLDGLLPPGLLEAATALVPPADFLRGAGMLVVAAAATVRVWVARGPFRRLVGPVALSGAAWAAAASVFYLYVPLEVEGLVTPLPDDLVVVGAWALNVIRIVVPMGIYAGILRLGQERAAVAEAIVGIARAPRPARLEDALRDALGDPVLGVFSWREDDQRYVDGDGRELDVAAPRPSGRSLLLLNDEGMPLAAVDHDVAIAEDPRLLASVEAAVRLTVGHERLRQQVDRQLEEVRASRARIVEATDRERRRIERDLHDGAQQRLVTLALRSHRAADRATDEVVAGDLREIEAEAVAILHDVRDLAAGIHPAILSEVGLAGAIEALASRSALAVTVHVEPLGTMPPATESTAYFVVAEALTNAAKHASAAAVTVDAAVTGDRLVVRVSDDGGGNADPFGSGLRGLADRVAAVGGSLQIDSPKGVGTSIVAELPCAS